MIFCTLPGLYENYNLNLKFLNLVTENKGYLIDKDIYFTVYGSFPQDPYSGNAVITTNYVLYNEIYNIINNYINLGVICRFDCSNLVINENDYNIFNKNALKIGENRGNQIEISSIQAYKFFNKKYPGYEYIWSQNSNLSENELKKYNFILVRNNLLGLDFYYSKNKIEKIISYPCDTCNLQTWSKCVIQEHFNINSFSNKTVFFNCDIYKNFDL